MCIESYTLCDYSQICSDSHCASWPHEHRCMRHKTERRYFRNVENASCELNFMPAGEYQRPTCPPKDVLSLRRKTERCYFHNPDRFLFLAPWICRACRRRQQKRRRDALLSHTMGSSDAHQLSGVPPQPPQPAPPYLPPTQPLAPIPAPSHVLPAPPASPSPPPSTRDADDPREATPGPSTSAARIHKSPRLRVPQLPPASPRGGESAKVTKPQASRSQASTAQASGALDHQVLQTEAPTTVAQTTSTAPVPGPTHTPPASPVPKAATGSNIPSAEIRRMEK